MFAKKINFVSVVSAAMLLASAGWADTVTLKSGSVLMGQVVKQTEKSLWLDIGPKIIEVSMDDVDSTELTEVTAPTDVTSESLFHTASDLREMNPRDQAKIVGPAVIKVSTPGGLGSGVIINEEGYAITNAHVIQGETNLRATVWFPQDDGTLRRVIIDDVEILAVNNHLDLALLKLKHPEENGKFIYAPLEMQERLEIGQTVFAIGNPLGLERTLSQGVISTAQRSFDGLTYIQTDAAINPGNSGGPLFNTKGEVIGITNMKLASFIAESLGFAIPARYVKDFIRNREAFAFDKDNPNSGYNYEEPPPRRTFQTAPQLLDGTGKSDKQ